ncbi:hypothetical protein Pmar_PMAR019318 [Perkinsus marinus ATCC 50983]|uniref:Zinc finger protein 830 n=1 Tax=Perkinsus marinus (strain ATCC 50983 / TXsc) TaxID=423536 RepID=C5KFT7_PERM5|nr:hypothetical protein Pmar_PMAR019318 [Perkinsus marinus ATCC 50983]EER16639.1 hypothetical protein Pmar_PMAR019318 [Perkinsus marinus ATCC 50983]|eukprot:XP_002784843.1 hypothetical protein Pmar_PMAR019318 [Perkinsus marinus ATCC 50983]
MSSASSQAHARALVRQARAAAESGGTGTPIPGVTDAVICVLCKKRVKTGRMWAIHSKTPQHQHLVQRLQLALVSQESKPAATETEDNEQHADKGVEGKNEEKSGLLSAGYGDDDDNESSGESEVDDGKIQNRPETPPADDVVVPPPRKETEMEAVGPIPANEDLLDSDDIRNYVTAELAGLVVSGTVYEYENGETGEPAKGKRKRRPMKKKKALGTSALPEGFFDDEDKAAEVFGREAPSKRRDKDMQIDMKKLELQLDAGDRRQLVEGNTRIEEDSDIITDE